MSPDQLNIIFVDDEKRILDGLRRQLHTRREHWNMRFALSGAEALTMLSQQPADIIVTDMRMPGMTGGQLLQRIVQTHPQMTRIVLSGQTDQADLLRDVGCIHQYLQKPCDGPQLSHAIERTFALWKQLRQPQLRLAANRITALPPSSQTYNALLAELSKDNADVSNAAKIVARDPALSVKLMQLVNSAFFGMPRKINSPHEAVVLLGLRTLRAIVVAGRLFEFVGGAPEHSARIASLWSHSFEIGEDAARLAAADGAGETVQQNARLAGLLCLIGRAIYLTTDPDKYSQVLELARTSGKPLSQCELEVFGASQDDLTAYAMGLWAFSDEIVAATAFQSAPSRLPDAPPQHPLGYLHLAQCLCASDGDSIHGRPELDQAFIATHHLAPLIQIKQRPAA